MIHYSSEAVKTRWGSKPHLSVNIQLNIAVTFELFMQFECTKRGNILSMFQ